MNPPQSRDTAQAANSAIRPSAPPRLPYQQPQLIRLGDIDRLTNGNSNVNNDVNFTLMS